MIYEPRTFNIPKLTGISERTIEEHLKLYQGYVKHVNLIHEKIEEMKQDSEANAFALGEVQRRLGFEWGGMKNHEAYFEQFEGGAKAISEDSELYKSCAYLFGSFDAFLAQFKATAMTRGVGWAMLYLDEAAKRLVISWVDEQHLGQLVNAKIVLALDMWEHSYMLDVPPSEKKQYVEHFFENLNWEVVANRVG